MAQGEIHVLTMLAITLTQPLTGDDLVKIIAVLFAGIAATIYAWKSQPNTAPPDMGAILTGIHQGMNQLLLNATPKTTTTTTTEQGDPPVKSTTTTVQGTSPVNQAAIDTVAGEVVVPAAKATK